MPDRSRLLIVSNRLPVTVARENGSVRLERSTGGLATGLRGPHERSGGLWIGWPGDAGDLDDAAHGELDRLLADLHAVPVWLDAEEVKRFYEGFSNEVLWPSFHYLMEQVPPAAQDWDTYFRVNERFAAVVEAHHHPDDLVWIHDYQLMLVPRLLRQRLPDARIGFFLHIPFPAPEVFRTLPHHERLLEGLLGADLVGFHTPAYLRHFAASVLRSLGATPDVDRIHVDGRDVRLGVFPMGVDAQKFSALAGDPTVVDEAAALRGTDHQAVLVGIDRLDHTKGVPRRLLALETLLRRHPDLAEHVRLVQVAVPSRTGVEAYQELRNTVDALVGRINGTFGTPRWVPVHYVYRSLDERALVALYRAADVMLVTPVRDGMNLVAKEFIASRTDEDGVLVLSEFAGAASELPEALLVNPYDVDRAADVYYAALTMPERERHTRMQNLRRHVRMHDVHAWASSFIEALAAASRADLRSRRHFTPRPQLDALVDRMRAASHLVLLLDYDGTLVPFAGRPEQALPDGALLELLRGLATRRDTDVHVVSGRTREAIEGFLGGLPLTLHAEHGFWTRPGGSHEWKSRPMPPLEWRERVLPILQQTAANTPGALVEEKTTSLAWHYRMVEPEFGMSQANELRLHLHELLGNTPVEVTTGEKVIEVRPHGINKGLIAADVLASARSDALIVAIGDDGTDEDMFAALPASAIAIHVGPRPSRALWRLPDVRAARRLLGAIVADLDQPVPARSPMTHSAPEPFRFRTRLTLTKLTGRQAADLAELLEHLRVVPLSVVFHHTHHFLVQHQHLYPEPPNDFAFWVTNVLQEDRLGERLAAIDTVRFEHLGELRDQLVGVIEDFIEARQALRTAPAGEEFHFKDAVSFILPTPHEAHTLPELADALKVVGASSITYHLFEARLRVGADDNDFSRWIEQGIGAPELAGAIRRLDPYSFTTEGLRTRLVDLIESYDEEGTPS
jgi:trehalose 6-phosphate synthase/phosphatase